MTIEFNAIEFDNMNEAFQHFDASGYGDDVIRLDGKFHLTTSAESQRLEAAGVEFSYLHIHDLPDGGERVISVPIN
ncbi:MAG: hypothetical protein U1D55_00520 [Phycisphaerae bacterium]